MGLATGTANLLPSAIHGRTAVDTLADDDELLVYEAASGGLVKILAQNLPSGGGGGSGASTDSKFVLSEADAGLPNSTVITAGDGVSVTNSKGALTIATNLAAGNGVTLSISKGVVTVAANISGGNGVSISTSKGATVAGLDVPGLTAASTLNLTDVIPLHDGTGHKKATVQDLVDLAQAGTTTPTVLVETITEGAAGTAGSDAVNEQQIVEFQGGHSSITGNIQFSFSGQSTSNLDVNVVDKAALETALGALSTIGGTGNVDCGDGVTPGDMTIEFVGSLAGASQSLVTVAPTLQSSSLYLSVAQTTAGAIGLGTSAVVECWKLDETNSGGDRSGEKGVATLLGPAETNSGTDGIDVIWNGSTSMSTSTLAGLAFGATAARSLSAWLKPVGQANGLFVRWECGSASLRLEHFNSSGDSAIRAVITNGTTTVTKVYNSLLNDFAWNFVVATWNGTTLGISVNGSTLQTASASLSMPTGSASVSIGAGESCIAETDEVTLWNVALSNSDISTLYLGNAGGGYYYPYTGAGGGTSEVHTLTMNGSPSWGTFTLSFGGETTSNISYNANAATVQAALRALTGLSAVTCSGTLSGGMTVTFPSALGDVALLTVDYSRLLVRVRRVQSGAASIPSVPGTNEVQRVTIADAASGTFTLDFNGTTIGPIPWNGDFETLQTAFDTASVDATVTGSNPFDVEFTGGNAETNVAEMTYDASGLQGVSNRPASHRFEVADWVDEGSGVYSATFDAASHQKGAACMLQVQILVAGKWRVATDEFDISQDDATNDVVVLVSGGSGSRCVIRVFVV